MFIKLLKPFKGFLDSSVGKESTCNVGDPVGFLGQQDPLEKGKATHSSILAWRIPQTVQSMGVSKSRTRLNDFHFHLNLLNVHIIILKRESST